ncbi:exonuclease domain-containing protein [Kordiimonas sp.]|uniref:exonuclease domain-containing protein n=1 Tax=Kordiimonas sp. TaxID=1970157 RepID=UPI003A8EB321
MTVYLCIDLEATCFHREVLGREQTHRDMETIEVGVVAMSGEGTIINTFQSYVKPTYTELSSYCTSVIGITDDMLVGAPDFPTMIACLTDWLETLPAKPDCWYSWGKYDLKQLTCDAGPDRWSLALPLPEHRNAKRLFQRQNIKKSREVGLLKALELQGLEFEGRHHSALDDATNVARLFNFFHRDD